MAIFELNTLFDWTRRVSSDRLLRNRDVLVSDGTGQVVLTNDGNVVIQSVMVGGVLVAANTYTQDVNVLTFNAPPAAGLQVIVVYNRSAYLDSEIGQFLIDACNSVIPAVGLYQWQTDSTDLTDPLVAFPDSPPNFSPVSAVYAQLGILAPEENTMDPTITKLIVLSAALKIRSDLANQNADDAILIKDGDTTIDTSKTSASSERAVKRLKDEYDEAFRIAVANRQTGIAIQNNWVPLPYPWSTPNMMPGEVNGPTY